MRLHDIDIPEQAIAELCRRNDVTRFALFGSILRHDFAPRSDIDVLVEFAPDGGPGLFGFAGMEMELTRILGRTVHLHTPPMLGPTYRDQVQRTAKLAYAA